MPAFHLENNRPRELVLGDRQGSTIHSAAAYRDPPFQEAVLPNGVRLVVVENRKQPVLSVSLPFAAGSVTTRQRGRPARGRRPLGLTRTW